MSKQFKDNKQDYSNRIEYIYFYEVFIKLHEQSKADVVLVR